MKIGDDDELFISHDSEIKNFNLLKTDNELFNEESYKPATLINAKRINLPKGGEDWEILENGKVVLLMKGIRFTNKEKEFLRSVDGMKFLISEYKTGCKSVVRFKERMQELNDSLQRDQDKKQNSVSVSSKPKRRGRNSTR